MNRLVVVRQVVLELPDGFLLSVSERVGSDEQVLLQVFFSFADEMWLAKQATDINISFAFLYHVI